MVKIPSLSRRTEPAATAADLDGRGPTREAGGTGQPVVTERSDEQTTYRSSAASGAADGPAPGAGADRPGDADRRVPTGGADHRDAEAERRADRRAAVARAATTRSPEDDTRRNPRDTDPDPRLERTVDGHTVDLDRGGAAARAVDVDRTTPHHDQDGDGVADREPERTVAGPRPRASLLATLGLVVGVAGALFVLTGALAGYGIALGALGAVLAVLGLLATRRRHIAGKLDALLGIASGLGAVVLGVLAMTGQFDWPTTDGDWVARLREWLDSQFADRF